VQEAIGRLAGCGIEVMRAVDPQDAMAIALQAAPDLILIDPFARAGGPEILRSFRTHPSTRTAPLVVRCSECPLDTSDHMRKPIDPSKFMRRIAHRVMRAARR
jgi:CheY-like chemotaxis protein